jgi:hypothetical protein
MLAHRPGDQLPASGRLLLPFVPLVYLCRARSVVVICGRLPYWFVGRLANVLFSIKVIFAMRCRCACQLTKTTPPGDFPPWGVTLILKSNRNITQRAASLLMSARDRHAIKMRYNVPRQIPRHRFPVMP